MPDYISKIAPNLWRWTAPHPDWPANVSPDSSTYWPQIVGSVLYRNDRAAVFIDALLPPDANTFWSWADQRVKDRTAYALTTLKWHRRSREAFVKRYGASTSRAGRNLPTGVESFVVKGAGETVFWLPEPRALVPGDRILGAAHGGLRLCPDSWLRYLGTGVTGAHLKTQLQPLLELPVEHVLVSHGEPVIGEGAGALRRLLSLSAESRSRA